MPRFRLSKEEMQSLAVGFGSCIASSKITVDGLPVRFMYREEADRDHDSGWRFMSGLEDDAYLGEPANFAIYDVNTIANYDPTIVPLLESPAGTAFEKPADSDAFVAVEYEPPEDG